MAEGDHVDVSEEIHPSVPTLSQPPQTHAPPPPTPVVVLPTYSSALPTHLPPPASSGAPLPSTSPTSAATNDQARIAALEVDPTPWAPPTQAPENVEALAPPTLYTSTVHPFTTQLPPPPAPSVVPLPPATFLSSEHVPPPMVFPASTAPAPIHLQATELPPYPSLQPHAGLSYQAPPPINTTFHEPGTPTHAALFASPTHFFPEADAEQERRLKRIEETIRALQAGDARLDARHGDGSLFPDMRLPPKFKIPEFKTYEGTADPRHHLRHYRGKMLQYWEYEEFVIHSFQDSLSGSALDWFMSLKAEDIPTWEDLSRKFTDQYRYCAETPPTLLELSTKEMARGQKFEEYAAKWRAQAAKHIPPINEAQQIQLFHSTLRGVYYSHLLAHTSSFSDLIEAGKKLDLGIKLGRMEDPTSKGEESSKKTPATSSSSSGRRGKEVTVNTVNMAQQALQQYSMNYTTASPVAPSYAPQAPQYRPQTPTQPIYYFALPPPPLPTVSSPVVHHYAPAPSQTPQYQPPAPRTSQPTQRASPPQDVPAREPYSDDRVPWTYEGGVGNLKQQFGVMGITRSGRLYENPATADKGKAPATEEETRPRTLPTLSKNVTEEEAEAFIKVIKASEYKVVDQMAKSPAHISLLALLLNSEPHREALMRVLTAAQKVKFIVEEKIITVKGEEDYAIYKETAVPYISVGDDENLPFHSFETISVIRDYGEVGPSRADRMIGKVILRHNYIPFIGLGARGQGINRPIEVEAYKHSRGLGFRPSCHEIIEARQGNHLYRLATHYGKLHRGIPVPPLSHFFPGPSLIIGSTSDGPSSDFDDTTDALPIVYAVTEEIPSGVHIRPAQEDEELNNWTSMFFDGALNSTGSGIGTVLISPDGHYYPVAAKIDFPCTNNVAEYEACILGLQAAIDFKVKELEVFGDSMLTIFQTLGQWKTKDAKLVPYHEYLEKLSENFEDISFTYTPRKASAISRPLEIEIAEGPAHCNSVEASEAKPWYEDIKNLLRTGQYPPFADRRDRKTLRRLAIHYFLSGEILYRRSFDSTLLRCIDEHKSQRLMKE
ncbi:hypothetical protein CRG98_013684, partial [Punica granatum]